MKTTANYGLKKPDGTDVVNIDDFNYNADILDTKIKEIDTKASNITVPVTSVNNKTGAVTLSSSDVGAVPIGRKVNSKVLSSDITLSATDIKTSSGATVESELAQIRTDIGNIETTAEKTSLNNPNFNSDNVNGALDELFTSGVNLKNDIRNVVNSKGGNVPENPTAQDLIDSINGITAMDVKKLYNRILEKTGNSYNPLMWYITQNGELVTVRDENRKEVYIEKYNLDNTLISSTKIYTENSSLSVSNAKFSMSRKHVVLSGSYNYFAITTEGVLAYSNLGLFTSFSSNITSRGHDGFMDSKSTKFVVEDANDGSVRTYTTGGVLIDKSTYTYPSSSNIYCYDSGNLYLKMSDSKNCIFDVNLSSGDVSYTDPSNFLVNSAGRSLSLHTFIRSIY